jgi:hydroxymethylpyrimidine/phosphomethylpyrimidine kinase
MSADAEPRILVIAGTDSSGGAGLTRDTATATQLGCRVAPVVTAVTVQTGRALTCVSPVPARIIEAQICAALQDAPIAAVKIGMIGSDEAARAIARCLPPDVPVVLDPVLKTTSGGTLGSGQSLAPLLDRVTLLTPNLDESAVLSGRPTSDTPGALRRQADALLASGVHGGPKAVLIKGGHGTGAQSRDHLFSRCSHEVFTAPRLAREMRGTGCTLATAIACNLAKGLTVSAACAEAKRTLTDWLRQAQ